MEGSKKMMKRPITERQEALETSKKMMKRAIIEIDGSDSDEGGYEKGKKETREHYRALLRIANEHRLSENEWNQAAIKVNYYAGQIEMLEQIINAEGKFDLVAELEKVTAEQMEAEADLAKVNVKVPDWFKLEERWLA